MSVDDVKKDLAVQLAQLALSGLEERNRLRKRQEEELKDLEENHRKEMRRMHGQEQDLDRERRRFEQETRRVVEENEGKMEEMKKKNKKEEDKSRKETQEQFRENLEQDRQLNRERESLVAKMFGDNVLSQQKLHNQERVSLFLTELLEIQEKWRDVKEMFETGTRYENTEENQDVVLVGVQEFRGTVEIMRKDLLTALVNYGKLKGVVSDECYKTMEQSLNTLREQLNSTEFALKGVIQAIKRKQPIDWKVTDAAVDACNGAINGLLHTTITLESHLSLTEA